MYLSDSPKSYSNFWKKVTKTNSCWMWNGALTSRNRQYGSFHFNGNCCYPHRISYEDKKREKIKKGLIIDHLCRNGRCVNPSHLELVSYRENRLRGKTRGISIICKSGHELEYPSLRKLGSYIECGNCNHIRNTNWYFKITKGSQIIYA